MTWTLRSRLRRRYRCLGPFRAPSPASRLPQVRVVPWMMRFAGTVWEPACRRWAAKQPQCHLTGRPAKGRWDGSGFGRMDDPFDLVLDQQPLLAQAVDRIVGSTVAFGGHHFLVLGVVLLVQLMQRLVLVDERLEIFSANVQVSEQIMRDWHFFTSGQGLAKSPEP